MERYFLYISYKGTNYHGWQRQENALTIQEAIENALELLLRVKTPIYGSGRTDTGVHALMQVAHFDANLMDSPDQIKYKLNSILDKDIAITEIRKVKPEAHTRFDALQRSYVYKIHRTKSPFLYGLSAFYPLKGYGIDDLNAMAREFIGEHDFQSFSRVKTEVNNFNCKVNESYWIENEENLLEFHISANRFLRGMVRAIVGTQIGLLKGTLKLSSINEVFEKKQRRFAGQAADPAGLYLSHVEYPESIFDV